MGLQNTDRFLTSLSDFQSKQEKDNKNRSWISVTIKRDRTDNLKKQVKKSVRQAAVEALKSDALMNPSQQYSLKYKAKYAGSGTSTEVKKGKAIYDCNQLVNVFRLHFFSEQRNPKSKAIRKEATKANPKSKTSKRKLDQRKRNSERRKKRQEIKVIAKKRKQQLATNTKSKHAMAVEETASASTVIA